MTRSSRTDEGVTSSSDDTPDTSDTAETAALPGTERAANGDRSADAANGAGYGAHWNVATPAQANAHAEAHTATVPPVRDAPTSPPLVTGTAAPRSSGQPPTASRPQTPAGPTAYVPGRTSERGSRGPRRARLQLRNFNPWTVLKFSSVLAVALFFVWLLVIGILFGILDAAGVIGSLNTAYTTIQADPTSPPITPGVVFGSAAIVGIIISVLFIALCTVGSVIYNLCADLVGGVEVTLSER